MPSALRPDFLSIALSGKARRSSITLLPGLLSQPVAALNTLLTEIPAQQVLIVSQERIARHYAPKLTAALQAASRTYALHLIPDGETAKTFQVAEAVYEAALALGLTRKGLIIALGGGVAGDLAGFCAASYYRGVPFLQIPTTLLAQIDSSVGGKVAVNFGKVKNAVGMFYQPEAVWIDPEVLKTLPERELMAGLGELTKYALIETTASETQPELALLPWLERIAAGWQADLPQLILRCCQIKRDVVMRDETEQLKTANGRVCLNLGHTFAHALESETDYQSLKHGEAVALGMRMALSVSKTLGLITPDEFTRARSLFDALKLPKTCPPGLTADALLASMRHDKKNATQQNITLVLPVSPLGTVTLTDTAPDDVIREALQRGLSD
ncbi:MAG: 3-dehydroquinate synthase [Vampirovibrionales bacterium]|nr:3-dehydroquinate synthase [Vampirovibrionales bacterium]